MAVIPPGSKTGVDDKVIYLIVSSGVVMVQSVPTLRITSADQGRAITVREFQNVDFEEGHVYELIEGRIELRKWPDPAEAELESWLEERLDTYAETNTIFMNHVTCKARVHLKTKAGPSILRPDLSCYANYPFDRVYKGLKWHDVSPVLVVEVLVNSDPVLEFHRNLRLYLEVPSIREYWVLDGRIDSAQPSLIQYLRHGGRWVIRTFEAGRMFTTNLLPGFELLLNPLAS